jgi:hypothetical protein
MTTRELLVNLSEGPKRYGQSCVGSPKTPNSRPMPDRLNPPKGAHGSCAVPLMTMRPASICCATAEARSGLEGVT